MIVLFNLNQYLGGGEVLAIRFAEYLKSLEINYELLAFDSNDCFIRKQAIKKNLNYNLWPIKNDSMSYMSVKDKLKAIEGLKKKYNSKNIEVFTFCFRDLYNACFFFPILGISKLKICTGIYHPEDVFYLSSFSFKRNRVIDFNRNLAINMYNHNSIVFANENALTTSLGLDIINSKKSIIPIPVDLEREIKNNLKPININYIKIICISRFVDFKIGAIISLLRFAKNNRTYSVDLVGYGNLEIILRMYIFLNKINNVSLIGKVEPSELNKFIKDSDIGFAQGTSIMEIAKHGKPVIIAPYGRLLDIFNKNFKCMGIFGEFDTYNYGDITDDGSKIFEPLSNTFNRLINNLNFYIDKSNNHLNKFSSTIVFNQIVDIIHNSTFNGDGLLEPFPKPSIGKRLIKKLLLKS